MSVITHYLFQFLLMVVMAIFKLMGLEISWWIVIIPIWINIILILFILVLDIINVSAVKKKTDKINKIIESVNEDAENGILEDKTK